MITDFKEIEHSALELDKKRRAELAKRLIKSLDEEIDSDIEQSWIDEVTRRKEEIKSGKVSPLLGEEVHKEARKILKK
ncbi:addiction module protein [Rhodohalobacter mucosus]|jgi:putative addiction module component (TIGR02574 family)|uniref:Acyl-protein synthetase n=1 Tax=Rhodohalobacter mucosus TaxID=2079485 RepID=A0A316TTV8_9BACT|nr:addiction module protein [Rhodohalobacter mucosus]PWN07071.1 acyl-protein synthetase [Rhodohalobacter mucosus]